MSIINDERFVHLIGKKVLETLNVPEIQTRSNIMSVLNFSGIQTVPYQELHMLAGTTLEVYVSYMLRNHSQAEELFDTVNDERFAFELTKAIMQKLKASDSQMYYNVSLTLDGEYPEHISQEMMDDLVSGTLFHLTGQ